LKSFGKNVHTRSFSVIQHACGKKKRSNKLGGEWRKTGDRRGTRQELSHYEGSETKKKKKNYREKKTSASKGKPKKSFTQRVPSSEGNFPGRLNKGSPLFSTSDTGLPKPMGPYGIRREKKKKCDNESPNQKKTGKKPGSTRTSPIKTRS